MSVLEDRRAQLLPRLGDAQIERITAIGTRRRVRRGEILFEKGQIHRPWFVVLSGSIEAAGRGTFPPIGAGHFTGEFDLLTGRPSLHRGVALEDGEVIEVAYDRLRALLQADPELSELLMRAFILRRMAALEKGWGNVVLVGSRYSANTLRLKEFLTRNGEPYVALDVDADPQVQEFLDRFRVSVADVPVVICGGKDVLRSRATMRWRAASGGRRSSGR
jgi:thioredoxin reductase (NADPH)